MTTSLQFAIKNFQRFVGIRVDGIIGPSTHKAMTSFNNCTKVEAELIQCSGYLAYKECTFFVNAKYQTSVNLHLLQQLLFHNQFAMMKHLNHIRYTSTGEGNTVMSCRNESDALASGYIYYANPKPPPPSSESTSTSLVILNLNATISIDENQKSVVTVDATGKWINIYPLRFRCTFDEY